MTLNKMIICDAGHEPTKCYRHFSMNITDDTFTLMILSFRTDKSRQTVDTDQTAVSSVSSPFTLTSASFGGIT